jgi:hypothetical protein
MKKFIPLSFTLSLAFGSLAALLCIAANFRFFFMLIALFCGFIGFILCCAHIVLVQRNEDSKQAPTGMLILSLLLNSAPLLCMIMIVWLAKH